MPLVIDPAAPRGVHEALLRRLEVLVLLCRILITRLRTLDLAMDGGWGNAPSASSLHYNVKMLLYYHVDLVQNRKILLHEL